MMDRRVCSEADLCENCILFLKTLSKRCDNFAPDGLSGYKRKALWPPSDVCGLCHMMSSADADPFGILPRDAALYATNSIRISYDLRATGTGGEKEGGLSQLWVRSHRGLEMTFAIWCDDDLPATSGIDQEAALSSDHGPESFKFVTKRLQACLQHHQRCLKSLSGHMIDERCGPELPTRVLDISKWAEGVVSLIESNGTRGNFCALSYCWGDGEHNMISTKETIIKHYAGISTGRLPQTFKDAIQVTSEIGIRYLWIDALCIIQDDADDWIREAQQMAKVYQYAYMVIAADGASHPGEGCFVRKNIYPTAIKLPFYNKVGQLSGSIWLSREVKTWDYGLPENGNLQKRGWALQEAYLARRSVHFMPGGISWSCQSMGTSERHGWDRDIMDKDWLDILSDYSFCKHTFKKDRLPAIHGLASAFAKMKGVKYHMGVLNADIEKQLMWLLRGFASSSGDIDDVPSWSWASLGGRKNFLASFGGLIKWPNMSEERAVVAANGAVKFKGYLGNCGIQAHQDTADLTDKVHRDAVRCILTTFFGRSEFQTMHSLDPAHQQVGFAATDKPYVGKCFFAFLGESEWKAISEFINEFKTLEEYPALSDHPSRQLYWVLLLVHSSAKEEAFRRIGVGVVWRDPEDGATTAKQVTIELV